jgi:thioredoxin reductase (NADPH)
VFVFIGAVPHSELVSGLVERDEAGFILTGQQFVASGRRPKSWRLPRDPFLLETSVPGIFAAGDVRREANRRVGSAVGDGGMAIGFINQYLRTV